ncbi:MAG: tetratricopeptide repeat protein [Anaerolineae bacterium]|nr:tetratricopeptide repeat protein [Anaerolineae bacterium]
MRVEKTVFISYRRTNYYHTRAIERELTSHGFDVFLDYDSIDSGSFPQIIMNQIAARAHFLIVLTPSALERCINPEDWMRKEIEAAIDLQRNIIPLMFENFNFGDAAQYVTGDKLPLLPNYNGLDVPRSYFVEAMERLRTRFLNKPLELILHPAPLPEQKQIAAQQQIAQSKPAPTPEQIRAEYYFESGFRHYNNGNTDLAIEEFNRAILLNPEFVQAYYRRGNAYSMKKDSNRAIADWQEALRLTSDSTHASLFRSNIYRLQKDFSSALAEADAAITSNPKDPEMYNNRGIARSDKGDNDGAMADYAEAIRLNPQFATAYNNRGIARKAKGDKDGAIADYTEAIRLNPQDADAYNNRGIARSDKGDNDGAMADYTEAIRLNPQYTNAYNNRGYTYSKQGKLDAAIADYEAALRIDPNHSLAKKNLQIARNKKQQGK